MENKINLAELLKDCPKGMELDCVLYNDVTFVCVLDGLYPIQIQTPEGSVRISKYGGMSLGAHAKCIIFPKGKNTWEKFQKPFKDGDVVALRTPYGTWMGIFKQHEDEVSFKTYCAMNSRGVLNETDCGSHGLTGVYLASEEEKEKLFKAIKDNGYEWNAETKTLVKVKTDKFDINTLIPFKSKVLVRDLKDEAWRPAIYGFYLSDVSQYFVVVGGFCWKYLIPYEGNEHLMGINDDCDEFYKTWE
jgi:hypothetical protein